MAKIKLLGEERKNFGRKVKKLRGEGVLPANIYGKKVKSLAIQIKTKDFTKVYGEAGETGMIDLSIVGEKETRPVLIHNIQKHPVDGSLIHADLRQVILTEKVTATIPVELIGESPVETQKLGILVQQTSEIEIEALPTDLPEHFQVDVSKLANVGDTILVKDLAIDKKKIEIKAGEDQIIAKIEPLAKEEIVTPPPAEEVPPEGVAPTEGEAAPAKVEESVGGEKKPQEELKKE